MAIENYNYRLRKMNFIIILFLLFMMIDSNDCLSLGRSTFLNLLKFQETSSTTSSDKQQQQLSTLNEILSIDSNWNDNKLIRNEHLRLVNFTLNKQNKFFTVYRTDSNEFFIGSNNTVYRIDLIKNTTNDNDWKFILYEKNFTNGPYELNRRCSNTTTTTTDNNIVQIFQHHSSMFVCGTNRCGLCNKISTNFSQEKIFATSLKNFYGDCHVDNVSLY